MQGKEDIQYTTWELYLQIKLLIITTFQFVIYSAPSIFSVVILNRVSFCG